MDNEWPELEFTVVKTPIVAPRRKLIDGWGWNNVQGLFKIKNDLTNLVEENGDE